MPATAWHSPIPAPACPACGSQLPPSTGGECEVCLLQAGLAFTPHPDSPPITSALSPLSTIAAYRVSRLLGQGGMGAVYLARQFDPIERDVAIKLIKPGMDSHEVLSRFRHERQALALMDHPNIARIFDAGTSADGRPYFAMEYIDGDPITTFCDRHRLSVRARLELMLQVCDAVRHAHQRGLLHRDLKPGNILVSLPDGLPFPKVIDFGVAKAIQHHDDSLTRLGQFVGTPEYMSPEQADCLFADVDTSTDVYSLGVVIYELLTGELPFDRRRVRNAGHKEMVRVICEEEATPLPTRIASLGHSASALAHSRDTDPGSLARQVSGDINWVVLKALEKSRHRRYPSVAELAADLQRCLNDEPVLAAPPSRWYLLKKFIRRNRGPVLMAAAVSLALAAGAAAALWQARLALHQRSLAQAAQAVAESRALEAERQRNRAAFQESLSNAHLEDVRKLASSLLFDLDNHVQYLSGGTAARQTLVRLGIEYLQKVQTPQDSRLAAAFYRVGELQGLDGLRDLSGARSSYQRSVDLAAAQLTTYPADSNARLTLALAFSRLSEIEWNPLRARHLRHQSRTLLRQLPPHSAPLPTLASIPLRLGAPEDLQHTIQLTRHAEKEPAPDPRLLWLLGNALLRQARPSLLLPAEDPLSPLPDPGNPLPLPTATSRVEEALRSLRRAASLQPANAPFQLSLIDAQRTLAQLLSRQNQLRAALSQAEQALLSLQHLAAADLDNPNLQVQLALTELETGTLTQRLGRTAPADQLLQQATLRLRQQSTRYPNALDLQIQVASALQTIGANQSLLSGRHTLAQQYQEEALALFHSLAKQHPANTEVALLRLRQHWALAATARHADNTARALAASRAALLLLPALPSLPQELSPLLHSEAHFHLAQSLAAARFGSDAIQAAEKAASFHPTPARLSGIRLAIGEWHKQQNQFPSARAQASLAIAGFQHLASLHPSSHSLQHSLQQSLYLLAATSSPAQQVEIGRQSVQAARLAAQAEPYEPRLRIPLQQTLQLLSSALRNANRHDEARLAGNDMVAALDAFPANTIEAADTRLAFFEAYLASQKHLQGSGYHRDAARLCVRVLPWVEDLARSEPGLQAAWSILHRFYGQAADAHGNAGDSQPAMQFRTAQLQTLRSRESLLSAQDWIDIGLMSTQLGWSNTRLQRHAEARDWWRQALVAYERAVAAAGPPQATIDGAILHERARHWWAYAHEALSEPAPALAQHEHALSHALWMCQRDPKLDVCRWMPGRDRSLVRRARSLLNGQAADPKTNAEWAELALAYGWVAADSFQTGSPAEVRRAAAQQALAINRRLATLEPTVENRNELCGTLLLSAEVALTMGRPGVNRPGDKKLLEEAIAFAVESAAVFDQLDREGLLPRWRKENRGYIDLVQKQARDALAATP